MSSFSLVCCCITFNLSGQRDLLQYPHSRSPFPYLTPRFGNVIRTNSLFRICEFVLAVITGQTTSLMVCWRSSCVFQFCKQLVGICRRNETTKSNCSDTECVIMWYYNWLIGYLSHTHTHSFYFHLRKIRPFSLFTHTLSNRMKTKKQKFKSSEIRIVEYV